MRPIKFRAWDKLKKKMAKVISIRFDSKGVEQAFLHYDNTPLNDDRWVPADCLELREYTDLKDKNGKKIFEGDIVRAMNKDIFLVCFHQDKNVITWVLKTQWDIDNKFSGAFNIWDLKEIEKIGNIYENKKLLKGGE